MGSQHAGGGAMSARVDWPAVRLVLVLLLILFVLTWRW